MSLNVTFTASGLEGTVSDAQVTFTIPPTHAFVGDLRVELFAPPPSTASQVIFSRTGATTPTAPGDDSDLVGSYTFADSASISPTWWQAAANVSPIVAPGTYRASTPGGGPNGGLNTLITPAFAGVTNPNGTWTLRFSDCATANTGSVSAASLGVSVSPPANDDFADAVGLFGSAILRTGNNRGATEEGGEPNYMTEDVSSTDGTVTRSVWYRWTAGGNGPASVDVCNTDYDTMLAVFSGTTLGSLTPVASNNNACTSGFGSRVNFTAVQGTTYQFLVDGCCGAPAGDFTLSLVGPGGPPLPFTPEGSAVAKGKPSNDFTLGRLKLNKDNGTATLTVTVPGEGKLSLGGKGLVKQRLAARGMALDRAVFGAGKFKLKIKAKGAKKEKLNDTGKVKVKAKVTFTPAGGVSATDTKKITLKKD